MPDLSFTAPFVCPQRRVEPAWIDHNQHMNMAYYSLLFDQSLDHLLDAIGIDDAYYQQTTCSTFILESHVTYLREVRQDDPLQITFQLLDWDAKRLHLIATMQHAEAGYIAATSEQMSMHVDLEVRRGVPFPTPIQARIQALMQAHAALPRPPQVGHVIGIPRH
jgi:acyl-CoA thioester hydrolase